MKYLKRFLGFFLCLALLLPLVPASVFAADPEVESMDDGYIKVEVSKDNGGFLIGTAEGNRLKKSDNNKNLLYHNGLYDTSFLSFRVGTGTAARDYLFGGSYPDKNSTAVNVTSDGDSIVATWGVEGITFTETFTLANQQTNEHGLVSIGLSVAGTSEPVQVRVLLDTCLGSQDYGYYQTNSGRLNNTLQTEQVLTDAQEISNFFAVDDISDPAVQARVISTPTSIAIGHWNNLAATLFDFTPTTSMNFTNSVNQYLTADSACAMYYSMSALNPVTIYYGVYSNWKVLDTERVAVNLSAPLRLNLNAAKTAFIKQDGMIGLADFAVHVSAENYVSATSQDFENVLMVITSTSGLRILGDEGEALTGFDFTSYDPKTIVYSPFIQNASIEKTLYFQAKLGAGASYERVTVAMYNNTDNGEIIQENLLGQKVAYILLPGSDSNVPQVHFTAMSPTTLYFEGTRHLYVSVANPDLMANAVESGRCQVWVTTLDNSKHFVIPAGNVTFTDGVADIVLDEEVQLPLGACRVEMHWTDAAVSQGIVTPQFQVQSAKVLEFNISDDPKYRNDSYGLIAAVKYGQRASTDDPLRYELRPFKSEDEYKKFAKKEAPYDKENYVEILLVFRGAFVGDRRYPIKDGNGRITGYSYYTAVSKETVKDGKSRVDNTITVNNCLDFEAGTMSVYYEDYAKGDAAAKQSAILCEFDGKLYTSVARTSVWEGKAALTKLEQGGDFALLKYDKNGVRKDKNSSSDPITLIWPNVYGYGQKLAGMVFKLAYGQFGVMNDGSTELGRVIGFSASLNLKFMKSPQQEDDTAVPDTYFGKMKELWSDWRGASIYQYAYHGSRYEKLTNIGMNDSTEGHNNAQQGVAASVMVPDILFGCGEGFVGLHFKVSLTIQNMIDSLPKISGTLEVNTIGDWSFGLEGTCKLEKFTMEAKLSFKSRDDIPIPDEIYFYMGGFDPGLNIDGCGTVWLKGLGGGISNIYDTIFMTSGLPPLKLTVKAAFSIIQILDGKAKLELSLSGIKLTATDLKIKDTIEVIQSIMLNLQWYPDLILQASIYVKMFEGTIQGNGYIALVGKGYTDWDFEMFARVRLCIPESIPAVGGMTLLGIDVGINTKKIWGAFEALSLSLGVTYYWGESGVHIGTGGDYAQPSYPSLLEMNGYDEDNPGYLIGYDEENDRYLYALFGTNVEPPVGAQIVGEDELVLQMFADRGIWSNLARTEHKFNLGMYDADNASTLVQANFPAASLEEAKAIADTFSVYTLDYDGYPEHLILNYPQEVPEQNEGESDEAYEARVGAIVNANKSANANVTWTENVVWDAAAGEYVSAGTGGTATFAFSLTDDSQFDKDWYFETGTTAADVVFYNVLALPSLTDVYIHDDGGYFYVSWNGVNTRELDSATFYLTKGNTDPMEEGVALGTTEDVAWDDETYLPIPADLPSGDYYLRAVYSKEGLVNGVVWGEAWNDDYDDTDPNSPMFIPLHYVNPNDPENVTANGDPDVYPSGDLKYYVSIPATDDANTTGYLVEILDSQGQTTDLGQLFFERAVDADGNPIATTFEVGGRYSMDIPDEPGVEGSATHVETVGLTAGESYTICITPYNEIEPGTIAPHGGVVYGDTFRTWPLLLPEAVTPTANLSCGGRTLTSVKNLAAGELAPVFTSGELTISAAFSEPVTGLWTLDGSDLWTDETLPDDATNKARTGSFNGETATISLSDLDEGEHLLTLTGRSDARGDAFSAQYAFTVDTTAPRLMISSPLNGSPFNADGTVTVSGVTDYFSGASVTGKTKRSIPTSIMVSVDGEAAQAYTPATDADGLFSFDVTIPNADSAPTHKLSFYAVDANGNATDPVEVQVTHPGFGTMIGLVLTVDGAIPTDGAISTASGVTNAQLALLGAISETKSFPLDPDLVYWTATPVEGEVSVSPEGVLNCSEYARGFVEAKYEVSTGAYITQTLALGLNGQEVSLSYTTGGTASGGGTYAPGETVTLVAHAADGTPFDHWELSGVTEAVDVYASTITFRMPNGEVTAKAFFAVPGDLNGDGKVNGLDLIRLKRYLLGESVTLFCSGDLNKDGGVNGMDLIRLKKFLLNEITALN